MKEIWKKVSGWPYTVSNFGRIRRITAGRATRVGRLRKPSLDSSGYLQAGLCDGPKKRQSFLVHKLVALAFVSKSRKGRLEINHKDGNKINNVATNLEWVTTGENVRHAVKTGLRNLYGSLNRQSKLTEEQVREIRVTYIRGRSEFNSRYFANKFGIDQSVISRIINQKSWFKCLPIKDASN
jgi:hypothetical protein